MIPRKYSSEGIILARRNFSEADRILTVYSRDFGKIHLLAKGIRRPISRKRGHVEIFSHIKFSAVSGKRLDLVTEAQIVENFAEIRKNLKKVSLAYFFVEAILRTTREEEPNFEIFELTLKHLKDLKREKMLKEFRKAFVRKLLEILGFWPFGKKLPDPDRLLNQVLERELSTVRVGRKVLKNA